MFFIGITTIFVLFLIIITFWVFLSRPQPPAPELVFNKPKVNIDLKILDSDQFKSLVPFPQMPIQFSYTAISQTGKTVEGLITATSIEEATMLLKETGLDVGSIEEANVGRENPFTPYYEGFVVPSSPTTTVVP